jgi:hypothetical protein
MVKSQKFWLI